jgi:hypothetical protein
MPEERVPPDIIHRKFSGYVALRGDTSWALIRSWPAKVLTLRC